MMTKTDTAEVLAKSHYAVEPNLRRVFELDPVDENTSDGPVALLEVVEGTIERGIEPIAFAADPARGIEFPSVIVEVSPREYEDICRNRLDISAYGWRMGREIKPD